LPYTDLRQFVNRLEQQGELKRIPFEVDPVLEMTEFADRAVKSGGPALLFEKAKGSRIPVLMNAFASRRRMELALDVDSLDDVAGRISELLHPKMPQGMWDKLKFVPKLVEAGSYFPRIVGDGPCKQVIRHDGFSLADYPVLKCWPHDGGRFITLPLVFSRNPDTGKRNCGMYRMQIFDERTTGMHWQTHKQGAEHYRRLASEGKSKRMDVAVAIGADPAVIFAAILPLPPDIDEMIFAGFLRCKPVEMVKCETVDLEVPGVGDRPRGLSRTGRASDGRSLRRPHGLLFARGRVSGVSRHVHHAAQAPAVRRDHRRPAADGRLLHGPGDRAHLPAVDEAATARGAGDVDAGRRRLP
jgi:4-hydroxy-3-polyprenylbenzoate decarboxylase